MSAAIALPLDLGPDQYLVDRFSSSPLRMTPLTPACPNTTSKVWMQAVSLRGVSPTDIRPPNFGSLREHAGHPYLGCSTASEALQLRFAPIVTGASVTHSPCPTGMPFPHLFGPQVDADGRVGSNKEERPSYMGVKETSVATAWQCSEGAGQHCRSLADRAGRVKLGKLHRFTEAGLEEDELRETVENLHQLADCYSESDAFGV